MDYKRITSRDDSVCTNCEGIASCRKKACKEQLNLDRLIMLENMIEDGLITDVVRCSDCQYLDIINDNKIYARCKETGFEFLPFDTDTRKHFCAFGTIKVEELKRTIYDSNSLFDACM